MASLKLLMRNFLASFSTSPSPPPRTVFCRKCGSTHPVIYGKKKGRYTDLIMAYRCGDDLFLCGVAGQSIDGNVIAFSHDEEVS
jgi:hypothetical protein